MKMKKSILAIAALLLTSCTHPAIDTTSTNNSNFKLEYLFSVDGCKVYRFEDYHYHYIAICPTAEGHTSETVDYGTSKHSDIHSDEIQSIHKN